MGRELCGRLSGHESISGRHGDFAALAQELSTGPSGPNGGDLGCGDPAQFVPEFAEAITNGAVGETLGPVETQFGFHVIRVDGYQADGLADARIADGLSTAVVDVDEFYGVWNADSGQVIPT